MMKKQKKQNNAPPTIIGIAANATQAAQSNQLAKNVTVEQNALIDASATHAGNGGSIAIWSEVKTTVAGILKAMGGTLSGNGGFIETSGHFLDVLPVINTGVGGAWLFIVFFLGFLFFKFFFNYCQRWL